MITTKFITQIKTGDPSTSNHNWPWKDVPNSLAHDIRTAKVNRKTFVDAMKGKADSYKATVAGVRIVRRVTTQTVVAE